MLRDVFVRLRMIQEIAAGPLGPHAEGFVAALQARGYKRSVLQIYVRAIAHLSRWLARHRLGARDLSRERLNAFVRRRSRRSIGTPVRVFFGHLLAARLGGSPGRSPSPTRRDRLERDFAEYLRRERRLADATVHNQVLVVRRFLSALEATRASRLDRVTPGHVTEFVLAEARGGRARSARVTTSSLRSFLRFLRWRGVIAADLASCVPTVPSWRLQGIPQALTDAEVERLLQGCDRRTAVGRRDRAILLLLVRLGLRAREAAMLTLDDIDWVAGELVVHGKGGRCDRLPLPRDVGAALADYVRRGRPPCATRRVFVRVRAPHQGFDTYNGVSDTVRRAVARAGLEPPHHGAHLLRHSAATQMLRRGASLDEIAQVLRHCRRETTTIYTKVDMSALRSVARPWPETGL